MTFSGDDLRTDTNFNWNLGVVNKVDGIDELKLKITQDGFDPNPDSPGKFLRGDGTDKSQGSCRVFRYRRRATFRQAA